jgi:site-specific DNA-methyltransferase (adenine-specific)
LPPYTTVEKLREYTIKDNNGYGDYDWDILANEWDEMPLADWGVDMPAFEEMADSEEENTTVEEDDFDEESDTVVCRCKRGDVWQLGNHRVMCGDSTNEADVEKLRGGVLADLWITDPPYNVAYKGGTKDKLTIENDNMDSLSFRLFLRDAFNLANQGLKDGGSFYVWFATREHINFESALNEVGLQVRQELIWNKNTFTLGRQDYQWKHEPCLYGWKGGAPHYFTDSRKLSTVYEDTLSVDFKKMRKDELLKWIREITQTDIATSVINEDKPTRNGEHPTMKPVKLIGYLIKNSSKAGDVIIDNFGGSGTTLIACEQLNRKCLMMEYDPHYCDVIIARWEKLTGETAIKIE